MIDRTVLDLRLAAHRARVARSDARGWWHPAGSGGTAGAAAMTCLRALAGGRAPAAGAGGMRRVAARHARP